MKKILSTIAILFSLNCMSQDSTQVTLSIQTRDLEVMGFFIYNSNQFETIYDSVKIKLRIPNPPSGNATVDIKGYAVDWSNLYVRMNGDVITLKSNAVSRLKVLLLAANVPYITNRLSDADTDDTNNVQAIRQFGRNKLRKQ